MTRRRVAAFVDALVGNRRPKPFRASTDDSRAMRAAIELRTSRDEDVVPSPQFVDELHGQLARQLDGDRNLDEDRSAEIRRISRRRWLVEGAVAASAAGLAVAIDRTVFGSSPSMGQSAQGQLSPDNGNWRTVAQRAALAAGAVAPFSTPTTVGFVASENGALEAVSGVCTHQGCLLNYNQAARRLDCPCHRTAFSLSGEVVFSQLPTPPPPLPRLSVRDDGGQVQVYVPTLT